MKDKQTNLFESEESRERNVPLAEKLRPKSLDEILGQPKLINPDSLLRQMIESGRYQSFILWGPPGTGKTTIARIIKERAEPFALRRSIIQDLQRRKP